MDHLAVISHLTINKDFYIILLCATLGSIKATVELDKDKSFCYKSIDVILGIISGTLVAFHYGDSLSIWFRYGLAIIAGATGALFLETLLQMFPQLFTKVIDKFLSLKSD